MQKKNTVLNHRSLLLRLFIIFGVLILMIVIFVWLDTRSMEKIKFANQVGDAFSKFAIGFGAIATGIGGLGLIEDWLKKQSNREDVRKSLKDRWTKQYPPKKYKKTFRVIQDENAKGVIYVQDLPNGQKHWITNPQTLRDLDMDYSQVKTLNSSDFQKIPSGGNINTKETE